MTILTPTSTGDTSKNLVVYLRSTDVSSIEFINEYTKVDISPSISNVTHTVGSASVINLTFNETDLVSGNSYSVKLRSANGSDVYRGKVFVTEQTIESYELSSGSYAYMPTENNDNEFILM